MKEISKDLSLFITACLAGDLNKVENYVNNGFKDHLDYGDLVQELFEYGQTEVLKYLLKSGLNILFALPFSLHWMLYNFYERSFFGDALDMQAESNEDDFVAVAEIAQAYGYPINIRVTSDSIAGKSSIGQYYLGKTELDLAIMFSHYNAISYLRKSGGKKSNELQHIAGQFEFLDTPNDHFLLELLCAFECGRVDEALALISSAKDVIWNKLIVISLLNEYQPILDVLEKECPALVLSYRQFLT